MKNVFYVLLIGHLMMSCGPAEKKADNTPASSRPADSSSVATPVVRNCQSVVTADQLGKSNVYQESAKPVSLTLTVEQDTSTTVITGNCYFDNRVRVQAVRKSGKPLFKRTLTKDDLLYFIDSDAAVERAVLQNVIYKPTFNNSPYVTLAFRLTAPDTRKTLNYVVFMNYAGEIVKVR